LDRECGRTSSPPETTKTPTVFRELVRPIAERLDVLARRRTDADGDQRLHLPAECGEVGLGVVAADHAALAQFAQNRRIKFAQLDHSGSPVE